MITDFFLKLFTKDPLAKRSFTKAISWRLVGSVDTMLLGWLVTGKLIMGATIGLTELLTKVLLYYMHERAWQGISFGLPTRRQQRRLVQQEVKQNLFKQTGAITRRQREELNNGTSFTLWLTGLSGAGKSTIAAELELALYQDGRHVYTLDGDNTRLGINSDLSFSEDDRAENIRRVSEICKLFNDAGIIVIASFISPFERDRTMAKSIIGTSSFVEVYVDASLTVCQQRDPKGLYKKAISGQIKNFTGIDSPYQAPLNPDIHLFTDTQSVLQCVQAVQQHLVSQQLVGVQQEQFKTIPQ